MKGSSEHKADIWILILLRIHPQMMSQYKFQLYVGPVGYLDHLNDMISHENELFIHERIDHLYDPTTYEEVILYIDF